MTVDRRPVATLAPIAHKRTFLPASEILRELRDVAADPSLTDDLRDLFTESTDDLKLDR